MKMSLKKNFRLMHTQKGIALEGLLLALAIIVVLVAFLYPKFARGQLQGKGQALGGDVVNLTGDLVASYTGQYSNLNDAAIISGTFLKNVATITNNGGTLSNNMGGTFSCSPSKLKTNNDSFTCTITGVKDGACVTLASALGRTAVKLIVSGKTVKEPGTPYNPGNVTCTDDDATFDATFS